VALEHTGEGLVGLKAARGLATTFSIEPES